MRIAAPLLALLIVLVGTVPAAALVDDGATAGVASSTADTAPPVGVAPVVAGPVPARIEGPTVTEINVTPSPGGSAEWRVSLHYALSDPEDRAAFEEYGRSFEAGDSDVGLDVAFFRTLASESSAATGREMRIQNVERTATVRNGTGVLRLSFTWTDFVTTTEDGFAIEDAVLMPGDRTWLASLSENQRLIVETPEGFQVTNTRFGLENGSVVVDGPHTFDRPLTITYQQTRVTTTPPPEQGTPWLPIGGAVLLGVVALGTIAVYFRRRGARAPVAGDDDDPGAAGGAEAAASAAADERVEAPAAADAPGGTVAEGGGGTEAGAGAGAGNGQSGGGSPPAPDPSLLSDEEQVEHLLERNGGRMKQARIVNETGWSDAKVSQLLSSMAEDGRIEKLRLGRENLISLPEEEP